MKDKKSTKKKKRTPFFSLQFLLIMFFFVLTTLAITVGMAFSQKDEQIKLEKIQQDLKNRLEIVEDTNSILKRKNYMIDTPSFIEEEARSELGFVDKNDYLFTSDD